MSSPAESLIGLLEYIEQVEKIKKSATFKVTPEFFRANQADVQGLPGVEFNLISAGDDVWMRLARLKEDPPPDPPASLRDWITLSRTPDRQPELRSEVKVAKPGPNAVDQILKIENFPGIKRALQLYLAEAWTPWAVKERPRRKSIQLYTKLFAMQQTIESQGAEAALELVWGMGYAVWQKPGFSTSVEHPLLTQVCEITLNPKTFDLEIRPRDTDPMLELDCYVEMDVEGATPLQAFWNQYRETARERPTPFEATTTEPVFKAAVGWLDSAGLFVQLATTPAVQTVEPVAPGAPAGPWVSNPLPTTAGPRSAVSAGKLRPVAVAMPAPVAEVPPNPSRLPSPGEKLQITDAWVIFVRRRTGHLFLQDIERLKKQLDCADEIPTALAAFVTEGAREVITREEIQFRGLSSSGGSQSTRARELYFPMPYNDEQVSIVSKLETSDGVVVQGPPGTGKTHTIANVICHFLAHGRRVLVTSRGEEALRVLQEKLPEEIRALSVSLLTDEHAGMKQFEHSIQSIATTVSDMQPARIEAQIQQYEQRLSDLHQRIAALEHSIAELAKAQLSRVKVDGREILPEELARLVIEQEAAHDWLTDTLEPGKHSVPNFTDEQVTSLREARRRVGEDLIYLACDLPAADSLLTPEALSSLHKDLLRARDIEQAVAEGAVIALIDSTPDTFERAKALFEFLAEAESLAAQVYAKSYPWISTTRQLFASVDPAQSSLQQHLLASCNRVLEIESSRRSRLSDPVQAPADIELNKEVREAIERLADGKSAFALPFAHKDARTAIAQITVSGLAPRNEDDWRKVLLELDHRIAARQVVATWNASADEFGMENIQLAGGAAFRSLSQVCEHVRLVHKFSTSVDQRVRQPVEAVFGVSVWKSVSADADQARREIQLTLAQHLEKGRLTYAMSRVEELRLKLDGKSGAVVDAIQRFVTQKLGSAEIPEEVLLAEWQQLLADLRRLAGQRPHLVTVERVTQLIDQSGAPLWAKQLRTVPVTGEADDLTPATWVEAWRWRIYKTFLERLEGHQQLKMHFERRKTAEGDLAKTYRALVAAKTWLGVFRNSPENVRQALQEYLNEIRAIGAGTGIRAVHHRQLARAAMERAYPAVPCWIMPQWRVSESIPPKIGSFDLVVIDEASQSDIWALPALLRGKKVLVVGDHKQVSPSAVGMQEQRIVDLFQRFLADRPHASQMRPDRSIYDLAQVVFAGNSVMLKEHFRCVPPIIEFSKREYYEHEIRPLRIPRASERLDPPLIDVFVKGGFRKGDINDPEARAILAETQSLIADPAMKGRTIGICTLLGHEQAKYIDELIRRHIPTHEIVARRIRVGDPPAFQGRESDVMLLSMVLQKGDRGLANQLAYQQRMNVAASRARDRMILFRSIEESELNPDSPTARLIAHFRQPFHQDARRVGALRDLCESDFEREMFDVLAAKGYRIRPQLKVGAYRIDFVVEGAEDRRLAIECDGDRYHGPGQWHDDMNRQRVLERAGWTFWRCFASSFVMRRKQVLDDLFSTLKRMGIDPLGSESVDTSAWVASRVVDPLAGLPGEEQSPAASSAAS